jgi:hypothetical protein
VMVPVGLAGAGGQATNTAASTGSNHKARDFTANVLNRLFGIMRSA